MDDRGLIKSRRRGICISARAGVNVHLDGAVQAVSLGSRLVKWLNWSRGNTDRVEIVKIGLRFFLSKGGKSLDVPPLSKAAVGPSLCDLKYSGAKWQLG